MKRFLLPAVLVAALALGGCAGEPELAGAVREPVAEVGDITLANYARGADATPFTTRAEEDGLLLVYFGYLSCPDMCPLTMADLSVALRQLGPDLAERVTVAMVSVDPERDDGAEIDAYLGSFFEEEYERYAALLAPDAAALDDAGARFRTRWEIEEHEPGERYDVSHVAGVSVVDDTGRVVRELPFGLSAEASGETLEALLRRIDDGAPLIVPA